MVNVPPIPPLLCSTPPPIDFGEDDEDVGVLPPTLDGVDDDFGDFLSEDDSKINEPLPLSRPPSAFDLPPASIYDDLMPPVEKDLSNHIISTPSPVDDKKSKDSKKNTKSLNFTEAFNFNVKNTNDEKTNKTPSVEFKTTVDIPAIETDSVFKTEDAKETELNSSLPSSQTECPEDANLSKTQKNLIKNVKELIIETSNIETKSNNNIHCMQNMVSIEDMEDDLSDDELYSPKTPKNFVVTDNLNDYFKIEEIKSVNHHTEVPKCDSKDVDTKSLDSLDNNESASLGNENDNEFKSFSSNSCLQNNFDMPPPLQDDTNSIDDDDFVDFTDFQDFSTAIAPANNHFVDKIVPVNECNSQQHHNDLECNSFNDFINYNTENETAETNNVEVVDENSEQIEDKYNEFGVKRKILSKQNSLELKNTSQETLKNKHEVEPPRGQSYENDADLPVKKEKILSIEESSHLDRSFGDFNAAPEINGNDEDSNDFGNFAEFPNSSLDFANKNVIANENIEESNKVFHENSEDDDKFDDFADFESHQEVTKGKLIQSSYKDNNNINENADTEDDDDFGDFNTAQPITQTASSISNTKTSQNTTTATPPLHTKNLNERISKVLQLMFTPAINQTDETSGAPKANKIQDIPFTSIDAAKALEYQWLISETRHSFIRSLGIDSRNILYGENWNPSLPRFAANLSFNPLKPMKPVQSSSAAGDFNSMLEPISIITSSSATLELGVCTRKGPMDWKSSSAVEHTIEALKDNTVTQAVASSTTIPYICNEPPTTEPVPLTIFENPLDNEEKFSKTPPISEMESVTTFSLPLPEATKEIKLPRTQKNKNGDDFDIKEVEEDLQNKLNISEVVVTSTFTGSFKETHIYTPPKTNDFEVKHAIASTATSSSSPTKASPIDFDYEKAAMGVIIDETVVKKEYRDVEYNPPYTVESLNKSVTAKMEIFEANMLNSNDVKTVDGVNHDDQESYDDFSEFQSVSNDVVLHTEVVIPKTTKPLEVPKTRTVSLGGMILSPAILIPQAISMENQKPKIEWGDSTANINPEELARIEELFPEPKSLKSSNSSQKSTPSHQVASTPSISATVANKELEGNINNVNNDDDDWSDFVSVTVTNNTSTNKTGSNNNIFSKNPAGSPFKQRSPVVTHRMPSATYNNSNNDDEWSEFVSSAPPLQQPNAYRVPQFNSGAWQNANFYNNPLSMYHKGPLNIPPTAAAATTHTAQKILYNNNNNYNVSQQPYQTSNNLPPVLLGNNQQAAFQQQQIHVMQNFSTAPIPTPERLSAAITAKNSQFQSIGSAKVAPSIALIPDLGFVAPAIPTHTSFINSMPKPSINTKK